MVKWTDEQHLNALTIARASSASEASRKTGIPRGTILTWMRHNNQSTSTNQSSQSITTPKKVQEITDQAIEEAKTEVKEYIVERVKQVSGGLLDLVEAAKSEALALIQSGQDPDDSKAQWLRSVVGAIAQGIEKHQLLEGKPTSRSEIKGEVKTAHEEHYHVIQELVNEDDEIANRLLSSFRGQRNTQGSG